MGDVAGLTIRSVTGNVWLLLELQIINSVPIDTQWLRSTVLSLLKVRVDSFWELNYHIILFPSEATDVSV